MKKNYLFSTLAASLMLMAASCSQEEIVSNGQEVNGPITITVNAPVQTATRAVPEAIDGYTLTAIMQLVDDSGIIVGSQSTKDISSGSATFTISIEDQEAGATQALFWADYVPADGTKVYNTDDLTNVTYNVTSFTKETIATADAFCGILTSLSNVNVPLTRPFSRVEAIPNDATVTEDLSVSATYSNAAMGYSVLNGETASTTTLTYTGTVTSSNSSEAWFTFFAYPATSGNTLAGSLSVSVNDGTPTEIDFTDYDGVTGDANWDYDLNFNYTPGQGGSDLSDISITVSVDDEYNKPQIAVGNYVYADGTFGTSSNDAVAIVYALADGKTDNSDYGVTGTPIAYAMGLTSVDRSNLFAAGEDGSTYPALEELGLENTSDDVAAPWAEGDYNGYDYTQTFETALEASSLESTLFNNYEAWKAEYPLTGTNLSAWYIPSPRQLADLIGATYGAPEQTDLQATGVTIPAITQVPAVYNAVSAFINPDDGVSYFGRRNNASNLFTPFIRSSRIMCVQTSYAEGTESVGASGAYTGITVNGGSSAAPFAIRPVITIFEAE